MVGAGLKPAPTGAVFNLTYDGFMVDHGRLPVARPLWMGVPPAEAPAFAGMTVACGNDGVFAGVAGIIGIFSNHGHHSSEACEGSACFMFSGFPRARE